MGNAGHSLYEMQHRAMHDGALRCALCADASPDAGHDWCPAAEGLVCETCCRRVLLGKDTRLYAIAATRVDGDDSVENLSVACFGCDRGRRWFAEQLHRRLGSGTEPY